MRRCRRQTLGPSFRTKKGAQRGDSIILVGVQRHARVPSGGGRSSRRRTVRYTSYRAATSGSRADSATRCGPSKRARPDVEPLWSGADAPMHSATAVGPRATAPRPGRAACRAPPRRETPPVSRVRRRSIAVVWPVAGVPRSVATADESPRMHRCCEWKRARTDASMRSRAHIRRASGGAPRTNVRLQELVSSGVGVPHGVPSAKRCPGSVGRFGILR